MRIAQNQWLAQVQQPLRKTAFSFALAFAFMVFSDIHELVGLVTGIKSYILIITTVPMIILVFLSGGFRRTLRWPAAKYWLGFGVWMVVALPFSSWRAASLSRTIIWTRAELPILFAIAGCVLTLGEFSRLVKILAWAAAVVVISGRLFAGQMVGRLELEGTTFSDPNDYAAHLIFLLPFLLIVAMSSGRSAAVRVGASGLTLYGLYLLLTTGSRGGLVALVVMLLLCLWKLRPRLKITVAVIAAVLSCVALIAIPSQIRARFGTIFLSAHVEPGRQLSDEELRAIESSEARNYTLRQSILASITHPLFGVGMGEFQNYEGRTSREKGEIGYWHETHNSYTQVSSELGIPALLFYVGAIVVPYRMLDRLYRTSQRSLAPDARLISMIAFCLQLSLIGFSSASFFLSLAYRFYLPALTGLAIAFSRAVQQTWEPALAAASNDTLYADVVTS